jgi:hypothetical protein
LSAYKNDKNYYFRYFNVIKPAREEIERQAAEDLLAEGKAVA